jgi:hypothetical protein
METQGRRQLDYALAKGGKLMVTRKIPSAVTVASVSLIAALVLLFSSSVAFGQANHVRWDIIASPRLLPR